MWKTIANWVLAFFGMARELEEHRISIRRLEERLRDTEEALKLVALELRHARELDAAEREKQLLKLEREVARLRELPKPKGRK
jgi:hypothetical protein